LDSHLRNPKAAEKIKKFKKHAGLPVFYSGSNESSLNPQFKWLDNTFKGSG
jgi:hypothetical protein